MTAGFLFSALLVVLAVLAVECRNGVDLSIPCDETAWSCLKNSGISFGKVRVYRSVGQLDTNAPASLKSAHSAGMTDLDAYIFPCITTSPYNVAHNITCKSAADQFLESVNYLAKDGITFQHRKGEVFLSRMWLDIEDENPSKYYDVDPAVNQAFIKEMTETAKKINVPVGIYTTKTYWSQIMADTEDYSTKNKLGNYEYPLWYPRYDGVDSMDFFAAFGGWESVLIKQTGGDVGLCGLSQVDSNYML